MAQNIYDNEIFFQEYTALRRREENYNNLLEQPAMARMLPEIRGLRVIDLGCGYGANCMDFVRRGAESVTGVDISQNMLRAAAEANSHERIRYLRMELAKLSDLKETFDFAYSSLAFHYIQDFPKFCRDIFMLLSAGGRLLFSQEHPIITASKNGTGHYNKDENGKEISYTFSDYGRSGRRESFWFVDGVEEYHRSMGQILTALASAGFWIEAVEEPVPDAAALQKMPQLRKEWIKPTFLIVKARKF